MNAPADAPAVPDSADGDAEAIDRARERRRTRQVIIVAGTLTVLVMAAVIALGWKAAHEGAGGAGGEVGLLPADPAWRPGGPQPSGGDDPCPTDPDRPPRMVFDLPPSGLHFGPVKQGLRLEKEVEFTNEGTGKLCIRRVDSGCGCIKAQLVGETREYEPGEKGRIKIALDTKSREGEVKKTITVYTNAVDVPLQRFVVRASVNLGLRFSPTSLRFGRVVAGVPAEAHLKLRAPSEDGEWEVTSVQGTRPIDGDVVKYEWSVQTVPDARERVYDVRVVHPGVSHAGAVFVDSLLVRTSHPDRPEFTVKTSITVTELIMTTPRRAVLGYVPNDIPARVHLRPGAPDVEFQVTGVSFERVDGTPLKEGDSGFVATFGREEGGAAEKPWWVEVRYDGREDRTPGPLRAVLVARTDAEQMSEVRFECFATVKGR